MRRVISMVIVVFLITIASAAAGTIPYGEVLSIKDVEAVALSNWEKGNLELVYLNIRTTYNDTAGEHELILRLYPKAPMKFKTKAAFKKYIKGILKRFKREVQLKILPEDNNPIQPGLVHRKTFIKAVNEGGAEFLVIPPDRLKLIAPLD